MNNRRIAITIIAALAVVAGLYLLLRKTPQQQTTQAPANGPSANTQAGNTETPATSNSTKAAVQLSPPLDRAKERVTKKPFGIYITPKTSPVQPEKFMGYHTGVDFEVFPEEQNIDVPIKAVCAGKLLVKRTASGYGGVLVQSCTLGNQPVTIIYGHMRITSVNHNAGDAIATGEQLGVLGTGYSAETDGERKHLHLGVHKGSAVNILGYVQNQGDLSGWLNALDYM